MEAEALHLCLRSSASIFHREMAEELGKGLAVEATGLDQDVRVEGQTLLSGVLERGPPFRPGPVEVALFPDPVVNVDAAHASVLRRTVSSGAGALLASEVRK